MTSKFAKFSLHDILSLDMYEFSVVQDQIEKLIKEAEKNNG